MITVETEKQLIDEIKAVEQYKYFTRNRLKPKIEREEKAWELIKHNRSNYTTDLIDRILYIVDHEEGFGWWFGKMIASNKKKVLEAPIEKLSKWIEYICFSGKPVSEIVDISLGEFHIMNAHRGLVTLLLYLSDPSKFAIWVKTTHEGLFTLQRVRKTKRGRWGTQYVEFNDKALEFSSEYGFGYREIDWVLWFIKNYVSYDGLHYKISAV
jgi:hypothetical protein